MHLGGSATHAGLLRPPQPDFAHPYPIQSGFTGRVAERKMLTSWLHSGRQPILALIAIGGMGKSALSWAWLQRDVLGQPLLGATDLPPPQEKGKSGDFAVIQRPQRRALLNHRCPMYSCPMCSRGEAFAHRVGFRRLKARKCFAPTPTIHCQHDAHSD